MQIKDFNLQGTTKISKINAVLKEEFGMQISAGFPKKAKLETIKEMSEMAIIKLKDTTKHFQLEPEYAKFLGVKDVVETMLSEGQYAESSAYEGMKQELYASVVNLMDSGCTNEETVAQTMNEFRKNPNYCYDDDHVKPIVIKMVKEYMGENDMGTLGGAVGGYMAAPAIGAAIGGPVGAAIGSGLGQIGTAAAGGIIGDKLTDSVLRGLSEEMGIAIEDLESYDSIQEKLDMFAEVSGKSRDSVIGFLNGLEEDALPQGIQMFGRKIAERKLTDSISYMYKLQKDGKSVEDIAKELDMKPEEVKDAMSKTAESVEENNMNMFDDIIADMLSEEVKVEEAEVVMAVRALADDIQDQIERIGRMVNEDIPAIADQMSSEMGAQQAAQFKDSMEGILSSHLETTKASKGSIDGIVGGLTGEGSMGGMGDLTDPSADAMPTDLAPEEPSIDDLAVGDNVPAAAGPEEEPLGRAPIE
jgi:outer membrane lipoprotein SlyB